MELLFNPLLAHNPSEFGQISATFTLSNISAQPQTKCLLSTTEHSLIGVSCRLQIESPVPNIWMGWMMRGVLKCFFLESTHTQTCTNNNTANVILLCKWKLFYSIVVYCSIDCLTHASKSIEFDSINNIVIHCFVECDWFELSAYRWPKSPGALV